MIDRGVDLPSDLVFDLIPTSQEVSPMQYVEDLRNNMKMFHNNACGSLFTSKETL